VDFLSQLAITTTVIQMAVRVLGRPPTVRVTMTGSLADGSPVSEIIDVTKKSWPRFMALQQLWTEETKAGRLIDAEINIEHVGQWAGGVW
jgi:hypothetical protein